MRIGIDARMWGPQQTGIGRYVDRLLYHLTRLDHNHTLVVFVLEEAMPALEHSNILKNVGMFSARREVSAESCRSEETGGSAVEVVVVRDGWYSWGEQVRLPVQFYRADLDLLHVPHFNVPLAYRRPFVVTVHDLTPWRFPGHKMGNHAWRRWAFRRAFHSAVHRARCVITVSNATKQDLISTTGRGDIDVVYEGPGMVDSLDQHVQYIGKNGVPRRPYIVAVGVWREHKNFSRLIRAFELFKQNPRYRRWLLTLGGDWKKSDPVLYDTLRQSLVRNDIITPGFIAPEILPMYYRAARAVAVPSLAEGFGFVGLEAMAAGTPVVAARAGSLPEIYGDAALFVDPLSVSSMAEGLRQVCSDSGLRARLLARGKEQLQQYSWRSMAEETLAIYEEAADMI